MGGDVTGKGSPSDKKAEVSSSGTDRDSKKKLEKLREEAKREEEAKKVQAAQKKYDNHFKFYTDVDDLDVTTAAEYTMARLSEEKQKLLEKNYY